jgi:hypothetical protein
MSPTITLAEAPTRATREAIVAPLVRFNEQRAGRSEDYRPLALLLSDSGTGARALPVEGLSWKIALWTLDRAMRSGEAIMASVCADGAEGLGRSSEGMAGLVLSRGHAGPPRLPPNKFRSRATSRRAQGSAWMLSPLSTHRTVCRCPSS